MSEDDARTSDTVREALRNQQGHRREAAKDAERERLERRRAALLAWWESGSSGAARWIGALPFVRVGKPPHDVEMPDHDGASRVFEAEFVPLGQPEFSEANRLVCATEARVWEGWWDATASLGDLAEWTRVDPQAAIGPVSALATSWGASPAALANLGPEVVKVLGSDPSRVGQFLADVRRREGGVPLVRALGLFLVGIARLLGKYPFDVDRWRSGNAAPQGPTPARRPRRAVLLAWDVYQRVREVHPEVLRLENHEGLRPAARLAHRNGWVARFYGSSKPPKRASTFAEYVAKGQTASTRAKDEPPEPRPPEPAKPGSLGPM